MSDRAGSQTDWQLLLTRLEKLVDEAIEVASSITFGRENPQHSYTVCLHGTILELAAGAVGLYRTGNSSPVPVLLRALLEAYVDLVNLAESADYLNAMHYAYLSQNKKLFDNALDPEKRGSHLQFLDDLGDVDAISADIRKELNDLRNLGIRKSDIRERFVRAGAVELYESVYMMLCHHSHNNLNVLQSRHLAVTDRGIRVSFFQPPEIEHHLLVVDTLAGIVVESTLRVFSLLGLNEDDTTRLRVARAALSELYGE